MDDLLSQCLRHLALVMNYHIENLQRRRNAADGIVTLVEDIVNKVSPEQY